MVINYALELILIINPKQLHRRDVKKYLLDLPIKKFTRKFCPKDG